ncbi:MAG: glycosyltransferase family 39 protein [bacterium]|jgi:hypothetical protein|nr:glycosyltransferase family 39 protein [bacterium]
MNPAPTPSITRNDYIIATLLGAGVFLILVAGLTGPGVTWDEGYPNFPAARNQAEWIKGLWTLEKPFSQGTIDTYWQTTSDHPSLPRTLAAVSYLLFSPLIDEIAAFRLPSALNFAVLVATLFLFLRLFLPRLSALAGGLALVLMPRVFGHAHLFSLDVPIMGWWFWAGITGFLVLEKEWRPWVFGLIYAIAFTTKLHAVFLPFPLLVWGAIQCGANKAKWGRLAKTTAWAAGLTPLVYIALQPWLWHDTIRRIYERFFDYAAKASTNPIRLYYLGQLYQDNTPWHYPLVMLAFTIPVVILILFFTGLARLAWKDQALSGWAWARRDGGLFLFLLSLFAMPLLLVLLPLAQGYDGCRLFLPCFPFAAAIAAFGYQVLAQVASRKLPPRLAHSLLLSAMVLPSLWAYTQIRPFYLAYYNEIAGGVEGAKAKGMETVYWCDALTRDMLDEINRRVEPGQTLRPLAMSYAVIEYYKDRGWLRADINHLADPPYDFHLLHCRQGMFTQAEWFLYTQRRPLATVRIGKVPLYALYGPLE